MNLVKRLESGYLDYLDTLGPEKTNIIRICAVSSSCTSLSLGLIGFYSYFMIHPSRRLFRQNLIFLLLSFDFIKALLILIYSTRSLVLGAQPSHESSFVNGIGWLTSFSIEGSDFLILSFAIHITLLIFCSKLKKPKKTLSKVKQSIYKRLNMSCNNRKGKENGQLDQTSSEDSSSKLINNNNNKIREGGLYKYRYIIYVSSILIPGIISSAAFASPKAYSNDIYWAYLTPLSGAWYFSWITRYCIVVIILILYISIYVFVMIQYKTVSKDLKLSENGNQNEDENDFDNENRGFLSNTFGDSIWFKFGEILLMLIFPDVQIAAKLHGQFLDSNADYENIEKLKSESLFSDDSQTVLNNNLQMNRNNELLQKEIGFNIQKLFHDEEMNKFKIRRIQIMKQMKVIFVYPLAYMLLWLFPFINQCVVLKDGKATEKLWSSAPAAFFQAFCCSIDTLVFLYRERPWTLRSKLVDPSGEYNYHKWRYYISWLPGYELGSNNKAGNNSKDVEKKSNETPSSDLSSSTSNLSLKDFLNSSKPIKMPNKPKSVTINNNSVAHTRRGSKMSWRTFSLISDVGSPAKSSHKRSVNSNTVNFSTSSSEHLENSILNDDMNHNYNSGFKNSWNINKFVNVDKNIEIGDLDPMDSESDEDGRGNRNDDEIDLMDFLNMGPK